MPNARHLIVAAAVAATGCASAPTPDADAVPARTILAPAMTVASVGSGVLVVKRDRGLTGSGCEHRLAIDGTPFAVLRVGEVVTIYAAPGEHVLSVSSPGAICPSGIVEAGVRLEAGKRQTFRTGLPSGWEIALTPTAY